MPQINSYFLSDRDYSNVAPDQVPLSNTNAPKLSSPLKKKKVDSKKHRVRTLGRLKFFDRTKKYGFIVNEETGEDIFVHYDDLKKAGLEAHLVDFSQKMLLKVQFCVFEYAAKSGKVSRKAVDIKMVEFDANIEVKVSSEETQKKLF